MRSPRPSSPIPLRQGRVARAVFAFALLLAPGAGADPDAAERARGVDAAPPPGPSVETRLAEIQRRVQDALVYPRAAQRRELEGEAQVEFVLGADGRAREVRTRASSGSTLLDRAAERAVKDAGALPYVYGRLVVPVRFALERED